MVPSPVSALTSTTTNSTQYSELPVEDSNTVLNSRRQQQAKLVHVVCFLIVCIIYLCLVFVNCVIECQCDVALTEILPRPPLARLFP